MRRGEVRKVKNIRGLAYESPRVGISNGSSSETSGLRQSFRDQAVETFAGGLGLNRQMSMQFRRQTQDEFPGIWFVGGAADFGAGFNIVVHRFLKSGSHFLH